MKKPFDVLAEGLISKNDRDDKTAIELFITGMFAWDKGTMALLADAKPTSR